MRNTFVTGRGRFDTYAGMKRRWRNWNLVCLFLMGLTPAALLVERVRGQRALGARLANLARRGEKLTIAELEPEAIAPEANVAIALFALTNQLSKFANRAPISLPSRRLTTSGLAVVSHRLAE